MTQTRAGRLLAAGGDLRQLYAAESLSAEYDVFLTGFRRLERLPDSVTAVQDDLPGQLDVLLLPMPVTQDGVSLHAPFGSGELTLSSLLPLVRSGGTVLGGRMTADIRTQIESAGLIAADYAERESFALRNAVPTAEAAMQIAMQELPVTLHGLPCLILGAGRLSQAMQPRLRAMGAEVTVAARRFDDLARREGHRGKPQPGDPGGHDRPAVSVWPQVYTRGGDLSCETGSASVQNMRRCMQSRQRLLRLSAKYDMITSENTKGV